MRRLVSILALSGAWCALWQQITIANLAAGAMIALAVTSLDIGTAGVGGIKIRPLTKLIGLVLVDLVVSTVGVAKEIITPTDRTDESIISIDIPEDARQHFLLLVVAITLTPGTAVVDADPDTGTLYLHLLHHHQAGTVRTHVDQIARLVCEALPTPPPPTRTATALVSR